jgi:2-iminobutanoate/2-iminopropanoate deaminase
MTTSHNSGKRLPEGASQHVTAGPYSPVLEIDAAKLVVISGQVAIDRQGNVLGTTVAEQTRDTIENCRQQLATAGCTLADVFKVNAFMTDLDRWDEFNAVYQELMPAPRPVRTTVGTRLLPGFLVELEMWAVKRGS